MDAEPCRMRSMKRTAFIILYVSIFASAAFSQDNIPLMDIKDDSAETIVVSPFFSHRLFNGQSTEPVPYGEMKMLLRHRMGAISGGFDNLFGLYQATSHIGFDYGFSKWISGGLGIGTMQKIFDGYIKVNLFRQTRGTKTFPLSLTFYSNTAFSNETQTFPDGVDRPWARFYYFHQLLVSRKFGETFSLQLAPFVLHRNLVATKDDKNNVLGFTAAFAIKLNFKLSFTGEFSMLLPNQISSEIGGGKVRNTASLGFEYHTGRRHVFHFFITNAPAMNEKIWLAETTTRFRPHYIRIGFNIPTTFVITRK